MSATIELKPTQPAAVVTQGTASPAAIITDTTSNPKPQLLTIPDSNAQQISREKNEDPIEIEFDSQVSCKTDNDCINAYLEMKPKDYLNQFSPVCVKGICKLKHRI